MRILQVHNRYRQAGGEDAVVAAERGLLRSAGHHVELAEFRNPPGKRDATRALLHAPWNATAAAEVVAAAQQFHPDVVHVHNTWFALSPVVFRALGKAGFPTVATVHNYRTVCTNALLYRDGAVCEACVGRLPWRGVVFRCYRDSVVQSTAVAVTIGTHRITGTWRHPDVVIALTNHAVPLLEAGGIPAESIVVKPNFVADPGVRPHPPSRSSDVLFVGRLSEEKGVTDLLEAWRRMDTGALRLVIVGDGPLRRLVEVTAQKVDGVVVAGSLDPSGVMETMKSGRLLVFPSRWYEGMPMVLLEAMAAGLGTVVPDHGGLGEVTGGAARSFRGGSIDSLVEILSTSGDDQLVDRLGSHARTRFEARFGPDSAIEAMEGVYQMAVARRHTSRAGRS